MAGVGLQDRSAKLDPRGDPTSERHLHQRLATDRPRVPKAGESGLLRFLGLLDRPLNGGGSRAQTDPHAAECTQGEASASGLRRGGFKTRPERAVAMST
jgi:hypothetical protein